MSENFKNTPLGMTSVLSLTAIIVGALLSGFFKFTAPMIEKHRLEAEKVAVFTVIENAADYKLYEKEIDGEVIKLFRATGSDGHLRGYSFAAQGPGFAGAIVMMVGLNKNKDFLTGMEVLEQMETPGLGDPITKPFFEEQFKGLKFTPKITYIKNKDPEDDNQIKALTGATISSKAVIKAINIKIPVILEFIEEIEKDK